jgi:very-short-patch-repair endonuclease
MPPQGEREFLTAWRRFKPAHLPDPQCTEMGGQWQFAQQALDRGWAFDFAWPAHKLALEIDGATRLARWNPKLKRCVAVGRHAGEKDYWKLNAAILLGWRVLRFTTEMVQRDPWGCVQIVAEALLQERSV